MAVPMDNFSPTMRILMSKLIEKGIVTGNQAAGTAKIVMQIWEDMGDKENKIMEQLTQDDLDVTDVKKQLTAIMQAMVAMADVVNNISVGVTKLANKGGDDGNTTTKDSASKSRTTRRIKGSDSTDK